MRAYYPWTELLLNPVVYGVRHAPKGTNKGNCVPSCTPTTKEVLHVPLNIKEDGDGVAVECFCAGADAQKFDVEVEGDQLTISGEFGSAGSEGDSAKWLLNEHPTGSFRRVVKLPFEIDRDSVDALFSQGILKVTVKKVAQKSEKKITIKVQ